MKKLFIIILCALCVGACHRAKTSPGRVGQMYFATISFATNGNEIETASLKWIDEAARVYKKNPDVKIDVRGYTDSVGTKKANLRLSKVRAQKVAQALQRRGVPKDHISAVGYGAAKPVASNNTPEGRQRNRRVEIEFPYPGD